MVPHLIDIVGLVVLVLVFVAGMALMAWKKTKHTVGVWRWVARSMDRSTRLVGLLCLLPGIAIAVWLAWRGLQPPAALVMGLWGAFGLFVLSLGLLGMEGLLLETESAARIRQGSQLPPSSSRTGRLVAILIGSAMLVALAVLLFWNPFL